MLAQKTLSVILKKESYRTESAMDGIEAIMKLKNGTYDLVIMDIHLPFYSGFEIIRHLRSKLESKTPVIILSSISNPQMLKQANELGISDYMMKPFNPSELTKKIQLALS